MFYKKCNLLLWKLQAKDGAKEKERMIFFFTKKGSQVQENILVEERFNNFLLELERSFHEKNA